MNLDSRSRNRSLGRHHRHFVLGCLVSLVSIGLGFYLLSREGVSQAAWDSLGQMTRQFSSGSKSFQLQADQALDWQDGDAVFAFVDDRWEWVGSVRNFRTDDGTTQVTIAWTHPQLQPDFEKPWEYYETPESMAWVANVMLPEDKVKQLSKELVTRFRSRQHELAMNLEPVIVQTIRDLIPVVEDRFRESLRAQQPAIEEVTSHYQSEIFEKQILPLVKSEIMPIVQARSQKLVTTIGAELFDRVSVWSFTWRYLYDVLPLTERELVRAEFSRFVRDDAVPVVESHLEEIVAVLKEIAVDVGRNPKVRSVFKKTASEMFHDPRLRQIFAQSLRDVFEDSQSLRELIRKNWESEAGSRVSMTLEEVVDPWLREAGAKLLGTPEEGLTKEFIAVLRSQILAKDRRWIVAYVREDKMPDSTDNSTVPSTKAKQEEASRGRTLIAGRAFPRYPILVDAAKDHP